MMLRNSIKGNSEIMRKINTELVINQILADGHVSRSGLARELGLALPTVMRIVDDLLSKGIVVETGLGNSSGGRKPTMLEMNEAHSFYIGVCIQRKLKVVLANAVGKIISYYEKIFDYSDMDSVALDQINEGIRQVIQTAGVVIKDNCWIGLGTPGSNFKASNMTSDHPFSKWATFDRNSWMEEGKLPFPATSENISKLGALAELRFGRGSSVQDFIYIYADIGIGAGIVTNGQLYMGSNGVAGEVGHTVIEQNGRPCYCGNQGCLEMYSSSLVILEELRQLMRRKKICINGISDPAKIQFSDALEAVQLGDEAICGIFQRAGKYLGIGLANLINLFNPQMIFIGGELSDCACYVEAARESALSRIFLDRAHNVTIETSQLGHDDLLKGAIALAMDGQFNKYSP